MAIGMQRSVGGLDDQFSTEVELRCEFNTTRRFIDCYILYGCSKNRNLLLVVADQVYIARIESDSFDSENIAGSTNGIQLSVQIAQEAEIADNNIR